MPKFHMNVYIDIDAIDFEGVDRLDLEDAKKEAVAGARDLIATRIKSGQSIYKSHRIEITDDREDILHVVRFGDILDIRL